METESAVQKTFEPAKFDPIAQRDCVHEGTASSSAKAGQTPTGSYLPLPPTSPSRAETPVQVLTEAELEVAFRECNALEARILALETSAHHDVTP
eukprot:SAG31_NODE_155_length_22130_cov_9.540098_9_plen_95_part_00